jgi:hypothetical protein
MGSSSSGGASIPGPSPQEKSAYANQAILLNQLWQQINQSSNESRLLQPSLWDQLGYTPQYETLPATLTGQQILDQIPGGPKASKQLAKLINPNENFTLEEAQQLIGGLPTKKKGTPITADTIANIFKNVEPTQRLTGLTYKGPSQEQQDRKQIEDLFNKRTLDALNGNLPDDPALLRDLDKQEQILRNQLQANLGTGYETSTPGASALDRFNQTRNNLLEASRRQDLSQALSGSLDTAGFNAGQMAQNFGLSTGVLGLPFQSISGLGQAAQGFGSLASSLAQRRISGAAPGGGSGALGAIGSGLGLGAAAFGPQIASGLSGLFGGGAATGAAGLMPFLGPSLADFGAGAAASFGLPSIMGTLGGVGAGSAFGDLGIGALGALAIL